MHELFCFNASLFFLFLFMFLLPLTWKQLDHILNAVFFPRLEKPDPSAVPQNVTVIKKKKLKMSRIVTCFVLGLFSVCFSVFVFFCFIKSWCVLRAPVMFACSCFQKKYWIWIKICLLWSYAWTSLKEKKKSGIKVALKQVAGRISKGSSSCIWLAGNVT